ncbi:hypothetical protein N7490_007381, partial [Penicillium lividum]
RRASQLRHGDFLLEESPWRNWLARLTVNQEVGSSSLPGDVSFWLFFLTYRPLLHDYRNLYLLY